MSSIKENRSITQILNGLLVLGFLTACNRNANPISPMDAQASVVAAGLTAQGTQDVLSAELQSSYAQGTRVVSELLDTQNAPTATPTASETQAPAATKTPVPSATASEIPTLAPSVFEPSQNEGGDNQAVVISGGVSSEYDDVAMDFYIDAYREQVAKYGDAARHQNYDLDLQLSPLLTDTVGLELNRDENDFWARPELGVGGLGYSGDEVRYQGKDLIINLPLGEVYNATTDNNLRAVFEAQEKDMEFAILTGILAGYANRYPTLDWNATGPGSARAQYDSEIHEIFDEMIRSNGYKPDTTETWIGSQPLTSTVSFLDGNGQVLVGQRTIAKVRGEQSPEDWRCVVYQDNSASSSPDYSDQTRTHLDTRSILTIDIIYDPANPNMKESFSGFIFSGAAVPDSLRTNYTERLANLLDTVTTNAIAEQARWEKECEPEVLSVAPTQQSMPKPTGTPENPNTPVVPHSPEPSNTNPAPTGTEPLPTGTEPAPSATPTRLPTSTPTASVMPSSTFQAPENTMAPATDPAGTEAPVATVTPRPNTQVPPPTTPAPEASETPFGGAVMQMMQKNYDLNINPVTFYLYTQPNINL